MVRQILFACSLTVLLASSSAIAQDPSVLADSAVKRFSSSRDTRNEDAMPIMAATASGNISQRCESGEATKQECRTDWRGVVKNTMTFLAVQDAGLFAQSGERTDTLQGKWFTKYVDAVTASRFDHWKDGDNWFMNDVGHPMQGATVGFLYIANDPRGQTLEISRSRAYWTSRLRAMGWAAVYEVQWEMGPVGEAGIGFEGRGWFPSQNGRYMTNGAGLTDFVMSPVGGLGWMVAEDGVDKLFLKNALERTHNPLLKLGLSALNPNRSVANLMRFRAPWHRDGAAGQ